MNSLSSIKILSRKSDLAIIQAKQVGTVLKSTFPNLLITYTTKKTKGDIDLKSPLSEISNPGIFTDDLRNDLIEYKCDLAVHSWKDLPLNLGKDTFIAGTLRRADQRDILFVDKSKISKIKKLQKIKILTSSPRRIYNIDSFVKNFFPFNCNQVEFLNIRGNIPTRFKKFLEGEGDALIIAKAAIDRLILNNLPEFEKLRSTIRKYIQMCNWIITPLSQNPSAPGQGALGLEIRKNDMVLQKMIEKISDPLDMTCVEHERKILQQYGGGCHQKIGVSFFPTFFGLMKSEKGETDSGKKLNSWEWYNKPKKNNRKTKINYIFPSNLENYNFFKRKLIADSVKKINLLSNHCIWISRKSALPEECRISPTNIIWTSGIKTWKALAKKGIWVNGTADGMGEDTNPNITALAHLPWIKLTHKLAPPSAIQSTIVTYELEELPIKEDLNKKKFFYWMSASAFNYASKKNPSILNANHSCGPGNTYKEIKKMLNNSNQLEISLSYNDWKENLLKKN